MLIVILFEILLGVGVIGFGYDYQAIDEPNEATGCSRCGQTVMIFFDSYILKDYN
jgi:hypothetical protein